MNTTAGSFALLGSVVPRDATVAAKLRKAGAIILGKANLSEWANFRGNVPSGFSGRGGQATNPYFPDADPSGSSSGSAISSAIGLAAGALGSETDGSILSPSNKNNLVGIKPTVGLTSRAGGMILVNELLDFSSCFSLFSDSYLFPPRHGRADDAFRRGRCCHPYRDCGQRPIGQLHSCSTC